MTASKTRRPARSAKSARSVTAPVDLSMESADVMLRGFDAIRKINDRAVQDAVARFAAAAEQLKARRQPMDLLAFPTDLVRTEIEAATRYWQEVGGATMELQAELLGCSSHLVDSDAVLQATHAMDALPVFPSLLPTRAASGRG